jgi:hypothetical protein
MRMSGWCLDGHSRPIRSRTMASYHLLLYAVSLQYSVRHSSIACVVQILKPKPALCSGTFEALLLGMDEVPDRAIIDFEATLGELRNQLRIVKSFSGPAAQATRGALRKSRSAYGHPSCRSQRCPSRAAAAPTGRRRGFLCRSNTKDSIIIDKTRLPSIVEILLVSGIGGRCGHRFDTYLVCCC